MDKEEALETLAEKIQQATGLDAEDLAGKEVKVIRFEEDIITFNGYILEFELYDKGDKIQ